METIDQITINKLINAATATVNKYAVEDRHTVGAAILDQDGKVHVGLNLYHFTGGPCAEIVVLAKMISEGAAKPLVIVAVGDRNRGILAPCGRCRQVLADYCPDIQVIVTEGSKLIVADVQKLLPYTYIWSDQQ